MGDRFIETVAAGEIIGIKSEPGQNPAGDIASKAALTDHIDRLFWIQFRNAISSVIYRNVPETGNMPPAELADGAGVQ